VRTFLAFGFLSSGCQNALIQTIGFLIIDKAGVSPQAAQPYVAGAMFSGAITALLAQWFVVRAAKMSAADLMRWGAVLAALGCVLIAASPSYISAVIGYAVASLGFGFARPGFMAGASLAMPLRDQGRVAGAVAAVNGINVAFAPLFVLLYEADRRAPFALMTVVLAGLFVLALKNPVLRRTPHAAA
jgi:MFS family permease